MTLIAAIVLTACNTGGTATPGLDGSPDLPAFEEHDLDDESQATGSASVTTTPAADGAPPVSDPDTAPDTTPDGSSVVEPSTTLGDEPLTVESLCSSLATDGYETRKATLAVAGPLRAEAEAGCPDLVARLTRAIEIEDRVAAFSIGNPPLTATDLACEGDDFSLLITSQAEDPIGIHAALRLTAEGVEVPFGSTLEPLVVWSLEPGASTKLEGRFAANRPTDAALMCEVEIKVFDATASDADASLGKTIVPQLAVDDVVQWLPYLIAQAAAVAGGGNPDLAAIIEDVRSSDYRTVVDVVGSTGDEAPETGVISVCTASVEGPDDRLLSVVYFEELEASSHLRHALFRRGNDDQWRWISSSVYFDSKNYWDCGTPSINL